MSGDDVEPLRFQELLPLAEVWAAAQARRGQPVSAMLLAQDEAFRELCTAAARTGWEWQDHEHYCGMNCEHNVDDIRSQGYLDAVREVEGMLGDESGAPAALKAWTRQHLPQADGGDE